MTDTPKQCKDLFNKLIKGEITQQQFEIEINKLKYPEEVPEKDWGDIE